MTETIVRKKMVMKLLVYGAGVTGSLFAARMHESGHDVSLLARGERVAALRRHGVQLAEADSPAVRRVPVPVVDHPAGAYDLIVVFVRTHQADAVLESLAGLEADVLFALNWAAGPEPLGAVIGPERVLLSFPTDAGTMDGDVVRYRPVSFMTRRVPMPVGEPDGRATPRLERIVRAFPRRRDQRQSRAADGCLAQDARRVRGAAPGAGGARGGRPGSAGRRSGRGSAP